MAQGAEAVTPEDDVIIYIAIVYGGFCFGLGCFTCWLVMS